MSQILKQEALWLIGTLGLSTMGIIISFLFINNILFYLILALSLFPIIIHVYLLIMITKDEKRAKGKKDEKRATRP